MTYQLVLDKHNVVLDPDYELDQSIIDDVCDADLHTRYPYIFRVGVSVEKVGDTP